MKYNAFISYRHAPLDMEIAKKVHTGLETYHIPKSVQKRLGIKKIERVFRDQEELPIGSNLSDNIGEALKESEHLIVICSPRTPESEWVQKEIETFIKLHGRENVLAVLVEGEPNESFPDLLLNDENGNPVEPLAADVRGETARERNQKFKTEILRLVAPVIGCNYDDLRQRHRERIIKRTVSLVSAAAAVIAIAGISFGLYHANVADKMTTLANEKAELADEKTRLADEILKEYRLKQENQSRFLAKEALNLYDAGEREDAALVAIAGLPREDDDRPFVPEAEYALSHILHVYDMGQWMSFDRTLNHDLTLNTEKLATDNAHLVTKDNGYNIYVWDTETWELSCKIAPEISERNYLIQVKDVFADDTGVYAFNEHYFTKYDFTGKKLYSYYSDVYIRNAVIVPSHKSAYLCSDENTIITVDLNKGTESGTVEIPVEGDFYSNYDISRDNTYLLFTYKKEDSDRIDMGAYNIEKNSFKLTRLSEDYVLDYCYTPLSNVAVISCNSDFITEGIKKMYLDLVNPQTGSILWSREIPATINYVATFDTQIKAHSYKVDDTTTNAEIIVAVEDEAFTFNELSSKIVCTTTLPGDAVTLDLRSDNAIGFVGLDNGNIETIDFHHGKIYSDNTIETKMAINQLAIMDGKVAIRPMRSSTVYIMKYHTADDLKEIAEVDYYTTPVTDPKGSDYFIIRVGEDGTYAAMSKEGDVLASVALNSKYVNMTGFMGDTAVLFTSDTIYYLDVKTGKSEEVSFESLGMDKHFFDGYITTGSKYAVLWDTHNISAIDLENRKVLLNAESDTVIGNAVITEDGSTVLVSATDRNLFKVDVASKTDKDYSSDSLREISDAYTLQYLAVSPDGKTAAMCCMDGMLRLINVSDGSLVDEIPFNAKLHCSLYFTADSKVLIMQGDDLSVKIRDIKGKTFLNSFDASYELKQPTQAGNGYIAVTDILYMYLIDTEHYGICAAVPYGAVYIPSDNTFILSNTGHLYSVPHKDYKALIKEAKKQFPDASLTDEEKVKYNLE